MAKSDMAKAFGGGGSDTYADPEDDTDSDLPADFESAYDEYASNPSAQTFWNAVEACTSASKPGGLALLIGKGKPKS